jgi:chromatin segregation and condensation protein Rec8/ScpA/Scc1 (kleisin family)
LREALVLPAELAGYRFESAAMVEHMLDHLERTPGALPLLQFAAARLWEQRHQNRRLLTDEAYRALGGITGALASHADTVMAQLPAGQQLLAKALLLRLVTPERTRAMVTMDELSEITTQPAERAELAQLVDRLVHARLLVVQTGAGEGAAPTVEIVHESLIHTWPLLLRWLDESHEDTVFLTELRQAARQWDTRGRPAGLLWRGEAADYARRWMRHYRGALTALQQEFLQAAFDVEACTGRTRQLLVTGAIVVLLMLVAAAGVALLLIRDAQKEALAQSAAAQKAETQVREQLERVQAEERARRAAEERERKAREVAEAAGMQVEQSNAELARKNTELVDALAHANEARQRADANAAAAEQARAETLRANERLQLLLERERERVRRLENQGGASMAHDVELGR